jgi:hypothetical protein
VSPRRPTSVDGLVSAHFITHAEAARWRRLSVSSWLLGFALLASVLWGWDRAGRVAFSFAEASALFAAGMSLGGGVAGGLTARYWRLLADLRADLAGRAASEDPGDGRRDGSGVGPPGAPGGE